MGLLGSLARRSTVAALRGGGRLLSRHVVPDSMSPWKLRKTASSTSRSIFNLAAQELRRRKKRRLAAEKAEKQAQKALSKGLRAAQPKARTMPKAARPDAWKPAWMQPATAPRVVAAPRRTAARVLPAGRYDNELSPAQQILLSGPASVRRRPRSGTAPAARRAGITPSYSAPVVRPSVPDEPRFDKNAWGAGRGLRSSGGFDEVRSSGNSIRRARNRRRGRGAKLRKSSF